MTYLLKFNVLLISFGKAYSYFEIDGKSIEDDYSPHIFVLSNVTGFNRFQLNVIHIPQITGRENHFAIGFRDSIVIGLGSKNGILLNDIWCFTFCQ